MATGTSKISPISRAHLRPVKRSAVLQMARQLRLFSRAQVVEYTGLSATTVTHLVRELLDEGYLTEAGAGESHGGRPQSMLRFEAEAELVIVIDLHPGRIEAVLADWDSHPVTKPITRPIQDLVEDLVRTVKELSVGRESRVKAVAVAVPGVASGSGGQVRLAPMIGLVDGQPLGDLLRERVDLPVVVDNDVNLMVVGEHVAGAAQDLDDILLVHVGEGGIGAAIMIDGKVRQGASGVAGEIGFLPLGSHASPIDGIGQFEREWSAQGITQKAVALQIPIGEGSIVRQLETRASTDSATGDLMTQVLTAWSQAITAVICALDPGRVLLSGEAANIGKSSLKFMVDEVARCVPGATDIRIAAIGSGALLQGAVRRAFDAHDSYMYSSILTQ